MTKKKTFRMKKKPNAKEKTNKVDPVGQIIGDRASWSISYEPFNGCWISFGYESDAREGESIEECSDRVFEFAKEELTKKAAEFVSQNEEE
jgi:hypothetical protein